MGIKHLQKTIKVLKFVKYPVTKTYLRRQVNMDNNTASEVLDFLISNHMISPVFKKRILYKWRT